MSEEPKSWWHTVPGILTAITGVMTALSGLLLTLHQTGILDIHKESTSALMEKLSIGLTPENLKTNLPVLPDPVRINLFAEENGGHLIALSNDDWKDTIDGETDITKIQGGETIDGEEAVYAFKDEQPSTFDKFEIFIPEPGDNIKKFELLISDDAASGSFRSIGHFQTQNLKFIENPYQTFKFTPVTAKYIKFKLLSSYGEKAWLTEFRLQGWLKEKIE